MRKGGVPVAKNMYTVAGNGPCNEELALRIQAGDKNAAERLVSQNEGYLTELARAYTPWCELEDLKQEAALALLDAAGRFDPAHGTKLLTYATPVMEAALSDYAARYSSSLSIPISRYNQLRRVAYLCAEGWDSSDAELVKVVCGELNASAKVAGALIQEYRTLFCVRQLGDDVFPVSCGGDPAVAYDRLMRRTLLLQRMEEVLTPRELNLVRSYDQLLPAALCGAKHHRAAVQKLRALLCSDGARQRGVLPAACAGGTAKMPGDRCIPAVDAETVR